MGEFLTELLAFIEQVQLLIPGLWAQAKARSSSKNLQISKMENLLFTSCDFWPKISKILARLMVGASKFWMIFERLIYKTIKHLTKWVSLWLGHCTTANRQCSNTYIEAPHDDDSTTKCLRCWYLCYKRTTVVYNDTNIHWLADCI